MIGVLHLALDTESDRFGDRSAKNTRNVLLTVCPPSATSLDEVIPFFDDESAWYPFLKYFDEELHDDVEVEWFNGGYEIGALWDALIKKRYRFISKAEFPPGKGQKKLIDTSIESTPHAAYFLIDKNAGFLQAVISSKDYTESKNKKGEVVRRCRLMSIKDASKIAGGKDSMSKNANAIRKVHPDWWQPEMNTKDELGNDDYNNGWYFERDLYPKRFDRFRHYSMQDAYSQAMIFRYLLETDQAKGLSRSGNSWSKAIDLCESAQLPYFKKVNFRKRFPPLSVESQQLYEDGLLGGYVFGKSGEMDGIIATKGDYKSSYPAGYWFEKLPYGKEHIVYPSDSCFNWIMELKDICRFILCEFDFKLKSEIYQPCISAYEIVDEDGDPYHKGLTKKVKEGHRRIMLTPEPYLDAIKRHYDITNFKLHEVRYFLDDGDTHYYRPAIKEFFIEKERNAKGTVFNQEAKLNMNGGMHGKNLQAIERMFRDYDDAGLDKKDLWSSDPELEQSQYPFYVGMWVMMVRRACLLNDIADANDRGIENLMADTDSMILKCDTATFKEIFKNKIIDPELERLLPKLDYSDINDKEKEWLISSTLGKISIEMEDIRTFRCWGLKRYLCVAGNGKMNTAFAGMAKTGWFRGEFIEGKLQQKVLSLTSMESELTWEQNAMVTVPGMAHTKTIERTLKHAQLENIWFDDELKEYMKMKKFHQIATHNSTYLQSKAQHMCLELFYDLYKHGDNAEEVNVYLKDIGFTEKDANINRKKQSKRDYAYYKERMEEERIRYEEGR